MNDRAAVKSPENPGFKPKNTADADLLRRRAFMLVGAQHAIQ
ncbi:MAG TPA: hypothetical protein VEL10_05280 [Gaiellaceae bacterium]|nr:hypothetical protein [Gaiellaceae bacterium]